MSASRRAWVFCALVSSCAISDSTPSYPFLPRARPATIRDSATDRAPASAERLPRPGVGVGAATAARNSSSVRSFIPTGASPGFARDGTERASVLGRRVDERVQGHQADDLALRDLDAFFRREGANRLERLG